jgi:hypothetical protein
VISRLGDDLDRLGDVEPLTDTIRRRAALACAAHATDRADLARLLDMLGLDGER